MPIQAGSTIWNSCPFSSKHELGAHPQILSSNPREPWIHPSNAHLERPRLHQPVGAVLSRIVLFHPAFLKPGGAELLCAYQARRLTDLGFDVRTVTFDYDIETWAAEHAGHKVTAIPKRTWSDVRFGIGRLGKLKARAQRAQQHLLESDLVLAHNSPCNWMLGAADIPARRVWQCNEPLRTLHLRLANPRLAARVDATPNGTEDLATNAVRESLTIGSKRQNLLHARAQSDIAMTRRLDTVFAISEFSRDNARAIYGSCEERVVYPFVRFPEGGSRSGRLGPNGLEVLVQSRLETGKNVDSVIRGFAEYLKGDPKAILHVVGDGPLRGQLQELAQELMPDSSCKIHGYLSNENMRQVYDRCQVFVLLTIDEPFGMVYPEAAARGLLMVGPDHGGPLEILQGGEIGHCIDPFEAGALVEALEELRSLSSEEVDRRRSAADDSCRARFGEEAISARLLDVLGLARKQRAGPYSADTAPPSNAQFTTSHPLQAILRFQPIYRSVLWGGRRMSSFRDDLPEGPIGESWELSDHERGRSVVAAGPLEGHSLSELTTKYGELLVGTCYDGGPFPLLVKLLDCTARLSVQVHPDDSLARSLKVAERGKTECWFMLGDGGELFQGCQRDVQASSFKRALRDGTLPEVLNRFDCRDGDFFFVPARTVHAIGAGCLLFEIQQTCDCTFRVYDWGRVGLDGEPRTTHLEQSLATIDFSGQAKHGPLEAPWHGDRRELIHGEHFSLEERRGSSLQGGQPQRCSIIIHLGGEGELRAGQCSQVLEPMTTYLVPAVAGDWTIEGDDVRVLHAWPE